MKLNGVWNEMCDEDDTFLNLFWKFLFLEYFGFFLFGHDYYSEIMFDNFGIMIESLIECSSIVDSGSPSY